jgi:hypothetical protein
VRCLTGIRENGPSISAGDDDGMLRVVVGDLKCCENVVREQSPTLAGIAELEMTLAPGIANPPRSSLFRGLSVLP